MTVSGCLVFFVSIQGLHLTLQLSWSKLCWKDCVQKALWTLGSMLGKLHSGIAEFPWKSVTWTFCCPNPLRNARDCAHGLQTSLGTPMIWTQKLSESSGAHRLRLEMLLENPWLACMRRATFSGLPTTGPGPETNISEDSLELGGGYPSRTQRNSQSRLIFGCYGRSQDQDGSRMEGAQLVTLIAAMREVWAFADCLVLHALASLLSSCLLTG